KCEGPESHLAGWTRYWPRRPRMSATFKKGGGTGLFSKHRKTLIEMEGWPLIDGWYWCPSNVVAARIERMQEECSEDIKHPGFGYEFYKWRNRQSSIAGRLAHKCEDGKIRAPDYIDIYNRKGGGISIYGHCAGCFEDLSEGVRTIILLEDPDELRFS
ncbi:MAG: hypothetical protein ACWGQW_18965, partial [bacterium]